MKTLKEQQFIEKAKIVHTDKCDYSKVEYIDSKTKVIIICPIHGEFKQTPSDHLQGSSCPKCGYEKTVNKLSFNKSKFIEKAKEIHGDKYNYSEVLYVTSHSKIIIICPIHGKFEQTAYSHLQGHGCNKCIIQNNTYCINTFIQKANKIHNNKYLYNITKYITSKQKIIITCPKHGNFEQKANNHLRGHGCPKCSSNYLLTKEQFIQKAKNIHGVRYCYEKVFYTGMHSNIIIICHKHGDFYQKPNDHIKGSGCPKCNRSKGEIAISDILEKHNIAFQEEYKLPNQEELLNKACKFEYDFYLPDYNLLIEFHGIQHYKVIKFFGGEEAFEKTKLHDNRKKDLAKMAGIKLIEFNYLQFKHLTKEQFEQHVIKNLVS